LFVASCQQLWYSPGFLPFERRLPRRWRRQLNLWRVLFLLLFFLLFLLVFLELDFLRISCFCWCVMLDSINLFFAADVLVIFLI